MIPKLEKKQVQENYVRSLEGLQVEGWSGEKKKDKKDNFQFARLMSKKTKKNQASYKANNQKERTRGKKKKERNKQSP